MLSYRLPMIGLDDIETDVLTPLSEQQLLALIEARRVLESLWSEKLKHGSGPERDVYLNMPFPWGYQLTNLELTMGCIGAAIDFLRERKEHEWYSTIQPVIMSLEEYLLKALPDYVGGETDGL